MLKLRTKVHIKLNFNNLMIFLLKKIENKY